MVKVNYHEMCNIPINEARKILQSLDDDVSSGRRKKLDNLNIEEKLLRRKLKNRVAAQTARDRKKAYMDNLEECLARAERENKILKKSNEDLRVQMHRLREENERLKSRLESPVGMVADFAPSLTPEECVSSQIVTPCIGDHVHLVKTCDEPIFNPPTLTVASSVTTPIPIAPRTSTTLHVVEANVSDVTPCATVKVVTDEAVITRGGMAELLIDVVGDEEPMILPKDELDDAYENELVPCVTTLVIHNDEQNIEVPNKPILQTDFNFPDELTNTTVLDDNNELLEQSNDIPVPFRTHEESLFATSLDINENFGVGDFNIKSEEIDMDYLSHSSDFKAVHEGYFLDNPVDIVSTCHDISISDAFLDLFPSLIST